MNPARPEAGVIIARVEELPDQGAAAFDFAQGDAWFSMILARRGDAVTAFENRCPHAGSPLERPDGRIVVQQGRYILCTAHGASFTLDTGACAGGPCNGRGLTPVAIEVANGVVRMR